MTRKVTTLNKSTAISIAALVLSICRFGVVGTGCLRSWYWFSV